MTVKEKRFIWIALFYIAYMMFPYVTVLLPVAFVSIAVSVFLVLLYPKAFTQNYFKWFLVYIVVLFVYCLFEHPFHINGIGRSMNLYRKLLIETAWILPNIMLCSIIMKLNNPKVFQKLAMGTIIILVASLLLVFPIVWTNAGILRENIRQTEGGEDGIWGLPSYTVMSCYSYFIPVIGYGVKHSQKRLRWLFFFFFLLFIYYIYKSEITTSLLATIFVVFFMLVYQKGGRDKNVLAFIGSVILLWLLYEFGVILTFVDYLVRAYEGTVAQVKLIEFRGTLMGEGESDNVQIREMLRERSLDCFALNPLIGGSLDVGGHSSLIDRLGSMGLLGFIPFVLMLVYNVKTWFRLMPDKGTKFFYLSGILIIFVFLYEKGLFSGQGMLFLFFILPVCIYGIHYYITNVSDSKIIIHDKLANN
ncbi:MAG: hypothetical protein K5778_08960 [Bacteroidaceae bacterium]|nr:hypothetical protein [Bacteroidaceae bacterium]